MKWIIKNTNAISGAIVVLIAVSIIVFTTPNYSTVSEGTGLLLTISTFLFSALSGFFISRANNRYNQLSTSWAEEDALFLSLFKYVKLTGNKKFIEKMRDSIDNYYITLYSTGDDYDYKWSKKYYMEMWKNIQDSDLGSMTNSLSSIILNTMQKIENTRNKSESSIREKLDKGQWVLLIVLAIVIFINLIIMRDDNLYSNIAIILFATSLAEVLLILWDLDRLNFGSGDGVGVESGQDIFEELGKGRFYHQNNLKYQNYKIPPDIKKYRLGMHGRREEFIIRVVENK